MEEMLYNLKEVRFLKKRDRKYVVILLVLSFFTILGFSVAIKNSIEYKKHAENAVTVVATVEDSYVSFRTEVNWNAGAGDYVEEEVTKIPYYTHALSYTFDGKAYRCGYGCAFEMEKGTQIELVIDSEDPEHIITEGQNGKGDFIFAGFFLSMVLIISLTWFIRRRKVRR